MFNVLHFYFGYPFVPRLIFRLFCTNTCIIFKEFNCLLNFSIVENGLFFFLPILVFSRSLLIWCSLLIRHLIPSLSNCTHYNFASQSFVWLCTVNRIFIAELFALLGYVICPRTTCSYNFNKTLPREFIGIATSPLIKFIECEVSSGANYAIAWLIWMF